METVSAEPSPGAPQPPAAPARIALVGVHGFGAHHLANLERLAAKGSVELVAVADPNPPAAGSLPGSVAVHAGVQELLEADHRPDIVIVATPIQTHAPLGLEVLAAQSALYLEKPPVASMADFRRLQEAAAASGRSVQIGFQSMGSHALAAIAGILADGTIGTLEGIGATGRWIRDKAYYKRSRWAGKRVIDGVDVVDGVATNPLAHAVATALRIAGARTVEDVASVETDLYHANRIESDDTSVIRIRTTGGLPITCALTLCATEAVEPYITLQGSEGTAVFHYTKDRLLIRNADGERTLEFGRDDLTENLMDHLATGAALLSSLDDSGAFMTVLEAIRTAPDPALIDSSHVVWEGGGEAAHAVIPGIEEQLERAIRAHATFSELGLPWALPPAADTAQPLFTDDFTEDFTDDGGRTLAVARSGAGLARNLSPRPYLHPVSTLGGTVVTDHLPADHPWHLGAGFALQDVNGNNFWGGRTFTRGAGAYVSLPDHGRVETKDTRTTEAGSRLSLAWIGAAGSTLLTEERELGRDLLDHRIWRLDFRSTLTAVVDVSLGSPGSNGREGGGYGGFFWRLPACGDARIFTADAEGEDAVHGTVAPWLAWSGTFGGRQASLLFAAPAEAADPWFVRSEGYPGVGSSLAWDSPVQLPAGGSLSRSFSVWICDGGMTVPEAQALAEQR
jgi:predicted dehydrogenase